MSPEREPATNRFDRVATVSFFKPRQGSEFVPWFVQRNCDEAILNWPLSPWAGLCSYAARQK
jgi:hypothetical protein